MLSIAHERVINESPRAPLGRSKENQSHFRENDMLKASTLVIVTAAVLGMTQFAGAQGFYPDTHYHNVPHTSTHTDYVRHGFHVDAVPHTTTHFHSVPHTSFSPMNYWQPQYVPHTATHVDYLPHQGHVDAVPHTTTHWDRAPMYVPHVTTHNDYIPHGSHVDAVPHTSTHWHVR